jgi:hypothetical protein
MAKNMKAYYAIRNKKSAEKKAKEKYDKGTREYLERLEREQQQKR